MSLEDKYYEYIKANIKLLLLNQFMTDDWLNRISFPRVVLGVSNGMRALIVTTLFM